ncbi:uncharacterized protein FA14DRAFT_70204 [Meira miltonrushii]|uniref:Uncharacterized protein n=1 Tax=Meira miltonrushii TaxID=1280837 RepID=A0A316VAT4_9BASI|nr:uncharacterized protein FA14DRAFT_70204 [Meira miltonrushii]PWN34198.1 hypothetical protein FA14DRAFT_70204 [Meira miltonrushii]
MRTFGKFQEILACRVFFFSFVCFLFWVILKIHLLDLISPLLNQNLMCLDSMTLYQCNTLAGTFCFTG